MPKTIDEQQQRAIAIESLAKHNDKDTRNDKYFEKGPVLSLDGITNKVAAADDADLNIVLQDFSMYRSVFVPDLDSEVILWSKWEDADNVWTFKIATDGSLSFTAIVGAVASGTYSTAAGIVEAGTYVDVGFVSDRDGDRGQFYYNEKAIATIKTVEMVATTLTNTGALNWGFDGALSYSKHEDYYGTLWNIAHTPAEAVDIVSGNIQTKWQYGSADLIVPSDDCADDDTPNWTEANGALAYGSSKYALTVTAGDTLATTLDEAATVIGRTYRATALFKGIADAGLSSGIMTLTGQPSDTETVTIGLKVYQFQTTLTNVDGNVKIGLSASATIDNLISAINLDSGGGTTYAALMTVSPDAEASAGAGDTMDLLSKASGVVANLVATTETMATAGSFASATLTGAYDASVGSTVLIKIFDNAGTGLLATSDTITLTAAYQTATVDWEATETDNKLVITVPADSVSDNGIVYIDEIETHALGCVAHYAQESISAGFVYDLSSNANHGTATSAEALNILGFATDGSSFILPTATPSAANASGVKGTVTWDTSYIYVCTATDTWERVGIATW